MPIVKGDRLADSRKLPKVSQRAAGFYAWFISSEQVDDYGRFRWRQESWREALFHRRDASPEPVTLDVFRAWFGEYTEAGLVRWFSVDGIAYGEFTNYQGCAPSKQRFHRSPEPPWSKHTHSKACAASARKFGKIGAESVPCGFPNGSDSEGSPSSVPPILRSTPTGGAAPNGRAAAGAETGRRSRRELGPWSREAVDDWLKRFPDSAAPGGRIGQALRPLVKAHTWERVRPVWQFYLVEERADFLNPQTFAAKFGEWERRFRGGSPKDTPGRHHRSEAALSRLRGGGRGDE